MTVVMGWMLPPQSTAISDLHTAVKPRSLLPTLDEAKDKGLELAAAVSTSSVSNPPATATAEALACTTTLLFTFHERVRAFFAGDTYSPIRESVNPEL